MAVRQRFGHSIVSIPVSLSGQSASTVEAKRKTAAKAVCYNIRIDQTFDFEVQVQELSG